MSCPKQYYCTIRQLHIKLLRWHNKITERPTFSTDEKSALPFGDLEELFFSLQVFDKLPSENESGKQIHHEHVV